MPAGRKASSKGSGEKDNPQNTQDRDSLKRAKDALKLKGQERTAELAMTIL